MDKKRRFRTKEVAAILGSTERTVRFYLEEGVVHPELGEAGHGVVRWYTRRDVLAMLVARKLSKIGIKIEQVRQILDFLKVQAYYEDGERPVRSEKAFENDGKDWVDFIDMEEIKEHKIRLFIIIHDLDSDTPIPVLYAIENKSSNPVLRISDMSKMPVTLSIDVTGLYEQVSRL